MNHLKNVLRLDNWINSFDPNNVNDVFEANSFSSFVVSPRIRRSKLNNSITSPTSPDMKKSLRKLNTLNTLEIQNNMPLKVVKEH